MPGRFVPTLARQGVLARIQLSTPACGSVARNPKLPHLGDQRRPQHPESYRGAITSTYHPIGFAERRDNVRSFRIGERAQAWDRRPSVHELGDRRAELNSARHDDRALDEVLQLADIARPV